MIKFYRWRNQRQLLARKRREMEERWQAERTRLARLGGTGR